MQSLTLLSLRVVTKVYVGQRIKGRKEWPELFSTARTASDGWNQRSGRKVLASTEVSF